MGGLPNFAGPFNLFNNSLLVNFLGKSACLRWYREDEMVQVNDFLSLPDLFFSYMNGKFSAIGEK